MTSTPQQQPPPRRLTEAEIDLLAKHAAERTRLDAKQSNERLELLDSQRAELIELAKAASKSP